MKPCLNQDTLRTTPTETFLQIARKTGFDAVELTMDKVEPIIEEATLAQLKKKVEDQRLTVASINGPENFNLLGEQEFSRLLSRTRKLASACRQIGCNLLVPVPSTARNQESKDGLITQTAQALGKLAEACGEDINLGLEFLGMQDCSINGLQTAAQVIRKVARDNVGLVIDSFHMYLSGTEFSEITKLDRDRILLVHVNDSEAGDRQKLTDANRVFPGEGVIELQRFKSSLDAAGYDGFLSLELLRPSYWQQDAKEIAMRGRKSLKRVFRV